MRMPPRFRGRFEKDVLIDRAGHEALKKPPPQRRRRRKQDIACKDCAEDILRHV